MAMRMRDLQLFVEVMREGSVSRAATKMLLAQQSVSERIHVVEHDLGVELFARSSKGMAPTPSGRRFLAYAEECLALLEEGARRARDEMDLRVGVLPALAQAARPHLDGVLSGHPFELVSVMGSVERLVASVDDGSFDLAIAPVPYAPAALEATVLFTEPLVCAVPPGSPLLKRRDVDLLTLLDVQRDGPAGAGRGLICDLTGPIRLCARLEIHEELTRGTLVELPLPNLPPWSVEIHLVHRRADVERFGLGGDQREEGALAS